MYPSEITKRDGRVAPFNASKIERAVRRCLVACGADASLAPQAADMAARLALSRHGECPGVEQVQDSVEVVMLALGLRAEARAYMAYRDRHAAARLAREVPEELRAAYAAGALAMGGDPLRSFQFFDKYSRYRYADDGARLDKLMRGPADAGLRAEVAEQVVPAWRDVAGRRETWPECVDRAIWMLRYLIVANCGGDRLEAGEWAELRDAILAQDVMPSMRLLAMAGEAGVRDNTTLYNCAYQAVDSPDAFRESLLVAMAGCGDGYSVESQFVRQLPFVQHQRAARPDVHVVADTSEGWADALHFGLVRWFDGHDVEYDTSSVRSAGSVMRVKGGRSSGPGPLRRVLAQVRAIVLSRQGSQLRPIDANDVMCATGEIGNSGGVRRTAKISLSDWGDTEMRDAKTGRALDDNPHRWNANNSAVWPDEGPSQLDLVEQMGAMFRGGRGERGIFSRAAALRTMPRARAEFLRRKGAHISIGVNPCGEIVLQSRQFCNLSQAVARRDDTPDSLLRKVRLATILGTIQSLATHFPGLGPDWRRNCEEERLLGVDVTGQQDCPLLRISAGGLQALRDGHRQIFDDEPAAELFRALRVAAAGTNAQWARRLGIRASASVTCDKPSGNSSVFLGCAPGIHGRKMRYGVRNVRVDAHGPVYRVLRACGVPMDPENGQVAETATTWVAHFPMAAPEEAVVAKEQSAVEQLEHWLLCKRNWTTHNPSCTVEYSPDEMVDVIGWVWRHRDEIGGLSFLPRREAQYRQLPYEETSREEYERLAAAFPAIDWSLIAAFEAEDRTTSGQELACSAAGGCELP